MSCKPFTELSRLGPPSEWLQLSEQQKRSVSAELGRTPWFHVLRAQLWGLESGSPSVWSLAEPQAIPFEET